MLVPPVKVAVTGNLGAVLPAAGLLFAKRASG